jgi:hypothetical protein
MEKKYGAGVICCEALQMLVGLASIELAAVPGAAGVSFSHNSGPQQGRTSTR